MSDLKFFAAENLLLGSELCCLWMLPKAQKQTRGLITIEKSPAVFCQQYMELLGLFFSWCHVTVYYCEICRRTSHLRLGLLCNNPETACSSGSFVNRNIRLHNQYACCPWHSVATVCLSASGAHSVTLSQPQVIRDQQQKEFLISSIAFSGKLTIYLTCGRFQQTFEIFSVTHISECVFH